MNAKDCKTTFVALSLPMMLAAAINTAHAACQGDWYEDQKLFTLRCSPMPGSTGGEAVLSMITTSGSCNETVSFQLPTQGGLQEVIRKTSCNGNSLTYATLSGLSFKEARNPRPDLVPRYSVEGQRFQTVYRQNGTSVSATSGPVTFQGHYIDETTIEGKNYWPRSGGCTAIWNSVWKVSALREFCYTDDLDPNHACDVPEPHHMAGCVNYNLRSD